MRRIVRRCTLVALPLVAALVSWGVLAGAATSSDRGADSTSPAPGERAAQRIERTLEQDRTESLTSKYPPPDVTAKGWLVYDSVNDEPIAGHAAGTPRPIASLAKLMTAYVVVDRLDLDETVTVPPSVDQLPADAARMGLRAGERWKASDLLDAMLVYSANDAALALATHVGDGSEQRFVDLMNDEAEHLGLSDTSFASATGLDTGSTVSTSTPVDLVVLADAALEQEPIRSAVATKELQLTRPGGGKLDPLPNRNPLLGRYDGVDGVKTGFTDAAGYMLVVHQVDDETGGQLLVSTFASSSEKTRAADSRALLDWARPLRSRLVVVDGGTALGSIPIQRSSEHLDVFACDDLTFSARVGQRLSQEVVVPRSIAAPVRAGDEVGELRVRVLGAASNQDDQDQPDDAPGDVPETVSVATVPVCAGDDVAELGTWDRIVDRARDWRSAWKLGTDEVDDAWSSITG